MEKTTIILLVVALIAGAAIGYALALPALTALQSKLNDLESKLNPNFVERIKARGVLIVGTSADWPPFEYVDKDGNVVGIDIEIAKRIAQELGVRLEVKDMKFAALIEAVQKGAVDIVLADMTPTAERGKTVDFSIPYYFSKGNAIVVLKDKLGSVQKVEDLYGKKIGVQLGTIQEEWAQAALEGKSQIITYDRVYPEMFMALKRGDIDVMVLGDTVGAALCKKLPELTIAFYGGGGRIGAAVALPQGAYDLKYVVNKVIEQLLESGEMEKIFESEILKWLGES
ncbi:MAG: ABC transporter substrate-binding protein [Thermofilaceae archaeon]